MKKQLIHDIFFFEKLGCICVATLECAPLSTKSFVVVVKIGGQLNQQGGKKKRKKTL